MVTVGVCSKLKTSCKLVVFTNKVGKNSPYFVGVFNNTIIPLTLVGYENEMITLLKNNFFKKINCQPEDIIIYNIIPFLKTLKVGKKSVGC